MPKNPNLTPDKIAELNRLHDEADRLKNQFATALKQHRNNAVSIGILKGQKERARKDHVEFYTSLGLNRQSAWQVNRTSRGLCRLCGKPAIPGKNHCESHEERIKNSFKGAKK